MARCFVVEGEALAFKADVIQPFGKFQPGRRRRSCSPGDGRSTVDRMQRIQREQILEIGQEQLLMLLLVVQAEHDALDRIRVARWIDARDQCGHVVIDVRTVRRDVFYCRARQKTTQRAREKRADRLIVRVEQIAVLRMECTIARQQRQQQEVLEEPRRVRKMPFGRTAFGRALDDIVLDSKRAAQAGRGRPHAVVAVVQGCRIDGLR
jgi:hypothetical protein